MPYYESVFIARPDISAAQVDGLVELFEKAIAGGGGSIQKKEYWGLRNLSYRIKKNRKGHYMLMNIDAPADAVAEMERQMRINEDVMRHMTLRVEELEEGPSVIVQNKDRDDRPRRGPRPDRDDRGDRGDRGPRRDSDDDSGRDRSRGDDE